MPGNKKRLKPGSSLFHAGGFTLTTIRTGCFFVFFLSIFVAFGWAQQTPLIHAGELKRGDLLYGRTRMAGNEMTEFTLKILAVQLNSSPAEHTILAEITNRLFYETGVLAGMSGSPVYYRDPDNLSAPPRLAGAVAYTSVFLKKPILGITTIRSMLRLVSYALTNRQQENEYLKGRKYYGLKPVTTPIGISGASVLSENEWLSFLSNISYAPLNIVASGISAGLTTGKVEHFDVQKNQTKNGDKNIKETNGREQNTEPPDEPWFVPGDACAVNLVNGDVTMSAFGTVTWVSNDTILAFGHPMQLSGQTLMPLHKAFIDAVIPLQTLSYKVGTLGKEAGAVLEDRAPAILGKTGVKAPRIPVTVSLSTVLQKKTFHYNIIKSPDFFNALVPGVILNSFTHYEAGGGETTLFYDLKILTDYKDKTIHLQDVIPAFRQRNAAAESVRTLKSLLSFINHNPLVDINVKSVDVKLRSENYIQTRYITDCHIYGKYYKPGDNIQVNVTFRDYKKGVFDTNYTFKLPTVLPEKPFQVIVSSGYFYLTYEYMLAAAKYSITHPEKIFEIFNENINGRSLVIWMISGNGIAVKGELYESLPHSRKYMMINDRTKQKAPAATFYKKTLDLARPVSGASSDLVHVKKP